MLNNKKIGFIGAGNMAEAIIKGLLGASLFKPKSIWATDVHTKRLEQVQADYKIQVTQDNEEVASKCDILILAVKPQTLATVCAEIREGITDKTLIISVAAGVSLSALTDFLQSDQNKKVSIVRTMPNTPAIVQEGATALSYGEHVSKSDRQTARKIFDAIGKTVEVDEQHMDAVTGLSGSGPAYIFMIIEALSDAGVKEGLARDVADTLAMQTVIGSAKLAQETGLHPGELKNKVTSPGGTTIQGVHALETGGLRATLINAVTQSAKRSREMGS